MGFVGLGQNDSGGQAEPSIGPSSIVWASPTGFLTTSSFLSSRGPTNSGVLYQQSGSIFTGGYGQIFPTGRS